MRFAFALSAFALVCSSHSYTQTIVISGNQNPSPGAQETYYASFNYSLDPYTTLTWSVAGGTITSQFVNPTDPNNISCTVTWDNNIGSGSLSLYDDLQNVSGEKEIQIGDGCQSANAGPDLVICSGSSTTIGSPAFSGYTYAWYPATGLNAATLAQPTASPSFTTTYHLTMSAENLLINGDFEDGYINFTTDYGIYPNGNGNCAISGPYGSVAIGTNPASLGPQYCSKSDDHSPIGANMLIVDGSCTPNSRIWYQTVSVNPNTTYYFSGWASPNSDNQNVTTYLPSLRLKINGTDILQNFPVTVGTAGCDSWNEFTAQWSSGMATTATLEVYDDNLSATYNDFSLDDLYFGTCPRTTDEVLVSVGSTSALTITPAGTIIYFNQYETLNHVTLSASPALDYQWYKNGTPIQGATSQVLSIDLQGLTGYTANYYVRSTCSLNSSNTTTLYYIGCDDPSDYPSCCPPPGQYCPNNLPLNLTAPSLGPGTTYEWSFYNTPSSYTFSNQIGNSIVLNATPPYPSEGVYSKSVKNDEVEYLFYVVAESPGCRIASTSSQSGPAVPNVKIMPNPASSFVRISSNAVIQQIELQNVFGGQRRVIKGDGRASTVLDITALKPGIYSFAVTTKTGIATLKLAIER